MRTTGRRCTAYRRIRPQFQGWPTSPAARRACGRRPPALRARSPPRPPDPSHKDCFPMRSISRSALAVAASLSLLAMAPAVLAQAKPKTLSGSAGSGKVMSFKELESCLKEQDGMADRVKQLQARRDTMDAERKGIQAEAEALKSGGEEINALAAKVKDFNERMKALGVDRERLTAGYNQRAEAQAAKATDWNARSKALDNDFQAYEDQRLDWRQRCANRPYLEEHEKIIRSGK